MADTEKSSKTEAATPQRLQEARKRGQVVQSPDLQMWVMLVGATLLFATLAPDVAARVADACLRFVERPEQLSVGAAEARAGFARLAADLALALAPVVLPLAALGIGAGLAQSGLVWSATRLQPDPKRLSPLAGWQRIASAHALFEFGKSVIKLLAVGAVLTALAMPLLPGVESWASAELATTLAQTDRLLLRMAGGVAATMTLVAGADFVYQRFSFLQQMRMTKQEVRDEFKQSEGDPQIKARIRRLQGQRSKRRMMAAVPEATVVITNPTHYAVALCYRMETMTAPKVVAKGVDFLAARIRRLAEEHGVPVVENPPLARALHAAIDIDDDIPPEHYRAVAEVIGFVMRAKGGGAQP